jgi:hypothetical protein
MQTINKGNKKADKVEIIFNEPMPIIQLSGHSSGDVTNGSLNKEGNKHFNTIKLPSEPIE